MKEKGIKMTDNKKIQDLLEEINNKLGWISFVITIYIILDILF